jgi:hypothetical protein
MRYTKEITDRIIELYNKKVPILAIAAELQVPERSIIAKLSSIGVYQKKAYVNKRGETPVKKSEHIMSLATTLNCDPETLESLEKVNKNVLVMLLRALQARSDPKST